MPSLLRRLVPRMKEGKPVRENGGITKKKQVHVAVVGAGLGGLAAAIGIARAGHRVTILERAPVFGEVGAGIQIPPNSSRILKRWGLLPKTESLSLRPKDFILRSYRDGKILSTQNLDPFCETKYDAPYLHIHRADLHRVLRDEAKRLGVQIHLGSAVKSINFDKPSLQIEGGGEFHADIILGADGLYSVCREALLGRPDPPHLTGDLAYRMLVKAEDMKRHPDLVDLASNPQFNIWMGPDAHAVGYLLSRGGFYNTVIAAPDNLPEMVNSAKADVEELLDIFKTWDPKFRALLSIVQETSKWRLQNSDEMSTWSHPSGTFALLGDACHATLPYMAQGAAVAVEDGAVLGALFENLNSPNQLKDVLVIYEHIRKARATRIVTKSSVNRTIFHMCDGLRQRERDRQLLHEHPFEGYPNFLADPELQPWLFGYDAYAEAQRAWDIYLRGQFPGAEGSFTESSVFQCQRREAVT